MQHAGPLAGRTLMCKTVEAHSDVLVHVTAKTREPIVGSDSSHCSIDGEMTSVIVSFDNNIFSH